MLRRPRPLLCSLHPPPGGPVLHEPGARDSQGSGGAKHWPPSPPPVRGAAKRGKKPTPRPSSLLPVEAGASTAGVCVVSVTVHAFDSTLFPWPLQPPQHPALANQSLGFQDCQICLDLQAHLIFIALHRYCEFYKLKVGGNLVSSKAIGAIFPTPFAHCLNLEILAVFQTFS